MPLKTFLNLSEERKKEILDAAFEEFALHEYKVASLSNIIRKLDIAKGSFYRYFENKSDLYFYLIEYASAERFKSIGDLFENPGKDFFDALIENFAVKIEYDLKYPLMSGFLYNLSQEKNNDQIGNIQLQTKKHILSVTENILRKHVTDKSIRSDIPLFNIAFFIVQLQWGMFDFLEMKYNISFRENILKRKPVFSISKEQILEDVKSFSEVLKTGISMQK